MKMSANLGSAIDPDDIVVYDAIVRIFNDDKIKTIMLTANGTPDDEHLSLSDCKRIADEMGIEGCFCVMIEDWTEGWIYTFGNYDDESWYLTGKTTGYA